LITPAKLIKKTKGRKWTTDFSAEDLREIFDEVGPVSSIYYGSQFNLSWFVQQVFRNQQGKPLKLLPFQQVMLDMLWNKKFPMVLATRGAGKTFILGLFALLKALLIPGSKIVIVGAGFRQAKLVFKYIEQLYEASPLVKEAISHWGGPKYGSDAARLRVGLSEIQAIPIGDGEKIRGLRATTLIADEFGSIPEEIFDIVIKPFTAVHINPEERAANVSFMERLVRLGADDKLIDAIQSTQGFGNQVIVSGTPGYRHNHFYKRFVIYKLFIQSKGDAKALKRALEEKTLAITGQHQEAAEEDLVHAEKTWHHYAIYQLPYTAIPTGFLDEDNIRSDRAAFPKTRFAMEYLAQFPEDSDGFIKRSWIQRATPKGPEDIPVYPELYGNPRETYVMGLDPARWNDNFGCVVLKITDRGKELVYCNAWERTKFSTSAELIREISKRFNVSYICMDTGGGGESVREWLCKKQSDVPDGELIWVIPEQMAKFCDKADISSPGYKILEMVDFSPSWISKAAHDVEACIEQCNILFPHRADENKVYDQYLLHFGKSDLTEYETEKLQADLHGLDDWDADRMTKQYGEKLTPSLGIMQHIDECVNETCAIVRTVTPGAATEKFDLPKLSDQPEGLDMRRRDRWSALMLANYAAKVYMGAGHHKTHKTRGHRDRPGLRKRGSGYAGTSFSQRGSVRWPST
jgi:hypothetical protein